MKCPVWVLGLPFDVTSLDEVREAVFRAAQDRQQLVFATPNVNFLAETTRNPRFRTDVLQTGLSLPDGMPVVWIGRLLGIPFGERVAGSDLLESLDKHPGPRRLRVYFFGGEPGASEAAMRAVSDRPGGGLQGVGAHDPGFTSVEQMSGDAVIDEINRCNPDLLIVALGAAKGHRWIEANRHRLRVPVISHLGAAVNFIAGRLQRAPTLMQRLGLEWVWRIVKEPLLARRYLRDGLFLCKAVVVSVLPVLFYRGRAAAGSVEFTPVQGEAVSARVVGRLCLAEVERLATAAPLADVLLEDVRELDAQGVGWLYARRYRVQPAEQPSRIRCDRTSREALERWRADFLCESAEDH